MMKRILPLIAFALMLFGVEQPAQAQIEKGNLMVGANVMNLNASFSHQSQFSFDFNPKVGYFVADQWVVGGDIGVHFNTAKEAGSTWRYHIGGFGRYYFSPEEVSSLSNHGRFFAEANLGFGGNNNTNVGVNYGIGPGYSYFLTRNVGLEALLKLQGITGLNSSVGLSFGIGFQIYLPMKN